MNCTDIEINLEHDSVTIWTRVNGQDMETEVPLAEFEDALERQGNFSIEAAAELILSQYEAEIEAEARGNTEELAAASGLWDKQR